MVDVCPHKSAALSEGRVTKCGKSFQCAYHGWTFDSKTGECIDIPQVAPAQVQDVDVNSDVDAKEDVEIRSKRRNGTDIKSNGIAVPAMISQGMVWLFPGGGLEEALLAPPPPIVPELEKDGYRILIQAVRDFPIDWTVLIENIVSTIVLSMYVMYVYVYACSMQNVIHMFHFYSMICLFCFVLSN